MFDFQCRFLRAGEFSANDTCYRFEDILKILGELRVRMMNATTCLTCFCDIVHSYKQQTHAHTVCYVISRVGQVNDTPPYGLSISNTMGGSKAMKALGGSHENNGMTGRCLRDKLLKRAAYVFGECLVSCQCLMTTVVAPSSVYVD